MDIFCAQESSESKIVATHYIQPTEGKYLRVEFRAAGLDEPQRVAAWADLGDIQYMDFLQKMQ